MGEPSEIEQPSADTGIGATEVNARADVETDERAEDFDLESFIESAEFPGSTIAGHASYSLVASILAEADRTEADRTESARTESACELLSDSSSSQPGGQPNNQPNKPQRSQKKAHSEEKRDPGRPPSKPPAPSLEKKGIVDSADNPDNRLEFVYSDPSMFKDLFTFFKNIKARIIHLRCTPTGLTFFTKNQAGTSNIVAHIDGSHVNLHYCESEFWLGINRETVDKMFAIIDKALFKITILQSRDDTRRLTFIFKDPTYDKDNNYAVALSEFPADQDLFDCEKLLEPDKLSSYPIKFTLTSKEFKKSITDASNHADTAAYEKLGDYPFQLTYNKPNLVYNGVYRTESKIAFESSLDPNAIFRCTFKVAHVKSLATSMVTDDTRVYCSEDEDMLFKSSVPDKALTINTFVKRGVV